ncbi:MAG: hypothetical protein ACI4RV_01265 [Eubacteriales bacterium]
MRIKHGFFAALFFAFLLCAVAVHAEAGTDITAQARIVGDGVNTAGLTDNKLATHVAGNDLTLTISSDIPMGGLYLKYALSPSGGTLNGTVPIAVNGFLHEYIPLEGSNTAVLSYPEADLCEIQVYSVGEVPDEVQRWEVGEPDTDILLFAAHSDDDQLFFAGLLPYYTARGVRVRVAYFINHCDTYNRTHELLDGLWHCGVTSYPDISPFPDGYSESVDSAVRFLESKGFSYSDCVTYQRALLDKYKPLVAVLHDREGEYGHGAHMLDTATFLEACAASENQYIPEKIYIHLYADNPLTLDIDSPLDAFGGKTAFQVSQEAFRFHKSQHWTWFYEWIYGKNGSVTAASQIRSYNPAKYGLYASRVGADTGANDMLENIVTYAEREAKAAKAAEEAKAAAEKAAREEQARLEEEAREKQRLAEESARLQAQESARRADTQRRRILFGILGVAAVGMASAVAVQRYLHQKHKNRKKEK